MLSTQTLFSLYICVATWLYSLKINVGFCLFAFAFEIGSNVAQAGLKLAQ